MPADLVKEQHFCVENGEDEVFVWHSSYLFEVFTYTFFFVVVTTLVFLTLKRVRERLNERRDTTSRRHGSGVAVRQNTVDCGCTRLKLTISKEEFFGVALICVFEALLILFLVFDILHFVPQFEDSLVTDKNKGEELSGHFGALRSFCDTMSVFMSLGYPLSLMIQITVFGRRLLSIFNDSRQRSLRLSPCITRTMKAWMCFCGVLWLTVTIFALWMKKSCVIFWKTREDGREYFNCHFHPPQLVWDLSICCCTLVICTNLCLVCLYFNRFAKLLNSRRKSSARGKAHMRENEPILKAMEKLTVLATTGISSSLLFLLIFFTLGDYISVQWCVIADICVNAWCLVLVFKWMDDVYVTLFHHRFCCMVWCMRSAMAAQLGLPKVAIHSMLVSEKKAAAARTRSPVLSATPNLSPIGSASDFAQVSTSGYSL